MRVAVEEFFECRHQVASIKECAQPHGHSYKVEVIVEDGLSGGMVMDFNDLKPVVRGTIKEYHRKDLNTLMDLPSCENFCLTLYNTWKPKVPNLKSVKLWEGDGKWALAHVDDDSVKMEASV